MSEGAYPDMPEALRIPQAERDAAWKGRRLKPIRPFAQPAKAINDPGTIRFLAERAAAEKARVKAKAEAKAEADIIRRRTLAGIRALKRAAAEAHQPATDGDDAVAKKTKTKRTAKKVVTRFKTKAGKKAEPLKKPRPDRAPRSLPPTHPAIRNADKATREANAAKRKAEQTAAQAAPKAPTKAARLESMLRTAPVSAADIAEQMGWEVHTTRAAITRVGYQITTEKKDGATLYSIAADAPKKEKADA